MAERLKRLQKTCSRHPDLPLFARLAELYLRKGMVAQALELCIEGCKRFPTYTTGFLILSKCYEAQGEFEVAGRALGRALRLDPDNPIGLKRLSRIYQGLDQPNLALKNLKQAARLDPLDPRLNEQLGQLNYASRIKPAAASEETSDLLPWEVPASLPPASEIQIALPPASEIQAESPGPKAALQEVEPAAGPQPVPAGEKDAAAAPGPPTNGGRFSEEKEIAALVAEVFAGQPRFPAQPADETTAPAGEDDAAAAQAPATPGKMKGLEEIAAALEAAETGEQPQRTEAEPPRRPERSSRLNTVSGLGPRDDDELIRLFKEIEEQQARTLASPASGADAPAGANPSSPTDTDADKHRIATVTLAEIYVIQGLTQRAIDTYRQILDQDPGNEEIRNKLAELEKSNKNKP
jgi:tetratricopeptide (TPR) repeat protein